MINEHAVAFHFFFPLQPILWIVCNLIFIYFWLMGIIYFLCSPWSCFTSLCLSKKSPHILQNYFREHNHTRTHTHEKKRMNTFFTLQAFGQYGWVTLSTKEADLRKKNLSCCFYNEALNKSHLDYQWNTLTLISKLMLRSFAAMAVSSIRSPISCNYIKLVWWNSSLIFIFIT